MSGHGSGGVSFSLTMLQEGKAQPCPAQPGLQRCIQCPVVGSSGERRKEAGSAVVPLEKKVSVQRWQA